MKKSVWMILSYVLVALVASLTTVACFLVSGWKEPVRKLQQLQTVIEQRFIGEADRERMLDAAADAMVDALGDRWSRYLTKTQYQAYQETMTNSYVGIGITVHSRSDGTGYDVIAVSAGSAAEAAGARVGDQLVAVDGASVEDMTIDQVADSIRGEEGTMVQLTVLHDGVRRSFTVERKRIETAVATGQMLPGQIGLIKILNFDDRCSEEAIEAVQTLTEQGAKALIFDVRNDPGGYKHELVALLDHLLPEGEVFRTVDYRGREVVDRSDASCVELPMAVLINGNSYSAAEFFAAALSEYDAAVIVGEKTTGKGYFQQTIELVDGSAVVLSVGKYFTPKGASLAGVGLAPDVEVPVDGETAAKIQAGLLAPSEDPQIQAAVAALQDDDQKT